MFNMFVAVLAFDANDKPFTDISTAPAAAPPAVAPARSPDARKPSPLKSAIVAAGFNACLVKLPDWLKAS